LNAVYTVAIKYMAASTTAQAPIHEPQRTLRGKYTIARRPTASPERILTRGALQPVQEQRHASNIKEYPARIVCVSSLALGCEMPVTWAAVYRSASLLELGTTRKQRRSHAQHILKMQLWIASECAFARRLERFARVIEVEQQKVVQPQLEPQNEGSRVQHARGAGENTQLASNHHNISRLL
jgi:hypothetical protein